MTLTDEFIEFLSQPENQSGFIWAMVGSGMIPEGVSGNDPRIIELCQRAKVHYQERKRKRMEVRTDATR